MLAVTASGNGNGLAVSTTFIAFQQGQAYRALFGKVMGRREAAYFTAFRVTTEEANDPQGRQDRKEREIASAVAEGFSPATARLSVKVLVPGMVNGVPTMTANPLFGVVKVLDEMRWDHGFPVKVSAGGDVRYDLKNHKSGKRKRRPQVKKSSRWGRLWIET